ncbi:hypothetical protein [Haloarchaeobius amylolyticus]|uniref:hypothetical protein n=1 Tax=Haloarchaeobius amylolyticus TaxID=1198296 RepID=UPI00226FD694|nr:hypothetical protein [Haloarchaeobius amylolyticus]
MTHTDGLSNTTTAVQDGIEVEKGIEPGDETMTVRYRVTSTREGAAAVRLVESLGPGFPLESLNLDGAGHGDWLLEEGGRRVALVDIVQGGESVTTSYVVTTADPRSVESVFEPPVIDMVDPVEPTGSHDAAAEAAASRPGPVRPTDADEEAVVDALVTALESGAVDAEQLETLRDHIAPAIARSDEVRFRHLQSRLEDFAAYADGLEALIDEHGTASDVVVELKADISRVRDDLAAASDELAETADRLDRTAGRVRDAEERLDDTADRVDDVEGELDHASGGHADVAARFDALEDQFATVTSRLDAVEERLQTVDGRLSTVDDRLGSMEDQLVGVAGDLERVQGRLDAVDDDVEETATALAEEIDALDERLDDLAAGLEETKAWRAQLGEAFQGRASASAGQTDDTDGESPDGDAAGSAE